MVDGGAIETASDKLLFTPGPLTTSSAVKQAMLHDVGSRDQYFIDIVQSIRDRLVAIAGDDGQQYTTVILQGSGTFSLEAVLSSTVPRDGGILVLVNGAYGRRLVRIAEILDIPVTVIEVPEDQRFAAADVDAALAADSSITHVSVVHCETTSGILNDLAPLAEVVDRHSRLFFVDAMSSFGGIPIDLGQIPIDYLVSSANKCIEGVPGFSFVIARTEQLEKTEGIARSVSFDLLDQYRGLEASGQFRFTPPTHALLAYHRALLELDAEGGVDGRAERYRANHETLLGGMRRLGFVEYLPEQYQSYIITSFRYPEHPLFDFEDFYDRLSTRKFLIYPGKIGNEALFRIGSIGRIFPEDVTNLLAAVQGVLDDMGIDLG